MPNSWVYQGKSIKLAYTADIPTYLRPDEDSGHLVQEVLDAMPPFDGKSASKTCYISENLQAPTVCINDSPIIWAIHRGHKARKPQLSPFVETDRRRPMLTDLLTVEVARTGRKIEVVRAYPGRRLPPLPWQVSCSSMTESIAFWRDHAYADIRLIRPGSIIREPPEWFLRRAA